MLRRRLVGGKWAERLTRRERSDTAALGTLHTRPDRARPDRVVRRSWREGPLGPRGGGGRRGGGQRYHSRGLRGRGEETLCGGAKRRLRQTVHIIFAERSDGGQIVSTTCCPSTTIATVGCCTCVLLRAERAEERLPSPPTRSFVQGAALPSCGASTVAPSREWGERRLLLMY